MPASPPSKHNRLAASPAGTSRASDSTDILQVLDFSKILTPEQVRPAPRTANAKVTTTVSEMVRITGK